MKYCISNFKFASTKITDIQVKKENKKYQGCEKLCYKCITRPAPTMDC